MLFVIDEILISLRAPSKPPCSTLQIDSLCHLQWSLLSSWALFKHHCTAHLLDRCRICILVVEWHISINASGRLWQCFRCLILKKWSIEPFMISAMILIWIFLAYLLLIVGPYAGILSSKLDERNAFDIIVRRIHSARSLVPALLDDIYFIHTLFEDTEATSSMRLVIFQ